MLTFLTCSEEPETFHYLAARPPVPLKTEFKPTLRVLARKPQPTVIRRIDPVTGLEKLTLDEGEEEVVEQKKQLSVEEQRAKSAKEREEKQKRYDEARARILGTGSAGGGSGSSTPGTVTPPTGTEGGRGKGRNRGGGVGIASPEIKRPESQSGNKELYDPNYTPKPGATSLQSKRNGGEQSRSGRSTPREDDQVIRAPKGPDGSGRGFGFAQRGGKTS